MIRQAAVCIVLRLFSTADDVILNPADRVRGDKGGGMETAEAAGVIDGRARWRVSWVRRENMDRWEEVWISGEERGAEVGKRREREKERRRRRTSRA